MLLYTKLAAPKPPKRRSRAGCTFCKEKKKKCDEARPQCSRCAERGQECSYEPVKPRQKNKKQDPAVAGHSSPESPVSGIYPQLLGFDVGTVSEYMKYDYDEAPIVEEIEAAGSPVHHGGYDHSNSDGVLSQSDLAFGFPVTRDEKDGDHIRAGQALIESSRSRTLSAGLVVGGHPHRHPDLAMISPAPAGSPHLEFVIPTFSEFSDCTSRRGLIDHFANVLSHLIVLRETESGNPFQQLVLPLCHSSSTVQNAIYALSSAHLEHRGSGKGVEKSLYFHSQAIQGLARLIETGPKANREELLAAIMLLVYYEVLVQRGRSNIVDGHLKGAMTVMNQNDKVPSPTGAFLERAFRFYDVIAALSFGKAPISTAPAAGCLHPVSPVVEPPDTYTSSMNSVDTLLGFSTTLWPILHRLSNLLSIKQELEKTAQAGAGFNTAKHAVLRTEFETTSAAIESALESWQPTLPAGVTVNAPHADDNPAKFKGETPEQAHLQSIFHNALAYRHSALVHLYRAIHDHPPQSPLVQRHTRASLLHCVATVSHAGPMAALLWPLFVAACEAITPDDRSLARRAFVAIDKRQGMTNIERGWIIVQEVWRRSDFIDAGASSSSSSDIGGGGGGDVAEFQRCTMMAPVGATRDLWRRVSEDMGVTIVLG